MKQKRYYVDHIDSQPPAHGLGSPSSGSSVGPRASSHLSPPGQIFTGRRRELPAFVEPGQQGGDQATLRFLEPRRLRRLDVEGPCPMGLSINGRSVGIVRPGENTFDPPLAINPGDVIQLEALEPNLERAGTLTGGISSTHSPDADTDGGSHE